MGIIRIKDLIFEYIRRDEEGNVEGITKAVDGVKMRKMGIYTIHLQSCTDIKTSIEHWIMQSMPLHLA